VHSLNSQCSQESSCLLSGLKIASLQPGQLITFFFDSFSLCSSKSQNFVSIASFRISLFIPSLWQTIQRLSFNVIYLSINFSLVAFFCTLFVHIAAVVMQNYKILIIIYLRIANRAKFHVILIYFFRIFFYVLNKQLNAFTFLNLNCILKSSLKLVDLENLGFDFGNYFELYLDFMFNAELQNIFLSRFEFPV